MTRHVYLTAEQRTQDRYDACLAARELLADPAICILDTETTGLEDGRPVQIAIIDRDGATLLDSLVNPGRPISPDATAIHGISDAMVTDAPTFADLADQFFSVEFTRRFVVYNAGYDRGVLEMALYDSTHAAPWDREPGHWLYWKRWVCAMELAAPWYGDWHPYFQSYSWKPLAGGDHTALGDCRATLALLHKMAAEIKED